MVSLNLYQTKITASDYNPSIDDSITVTVTLLDFNGNAVTGTNATIEVNQGYFTKYTRNSSDTSISGTSTKSYTGNTGSNGSFTMTYKCSEWGLATFSANTAKIQCNVTGWKQIDSNSSIGATATQYVNKTIRLGHIRITGSPTSNFVNGKLLLTLTDYKPAAGNHAAPLYHSGWNITGTNGGKMICYIEGDTSVKIKMANSESFTCNGENGITGDIYYKISK